MSHFIVFIYFIFDSIFFDTWFLLLINKFLSCSSSFCPNFQKINTNSIWIWNKLKMNIRILKTHFIIETLTWNKTWVVKNLCYFWINWYHNLWRFYQLLVPFFDFLFRPCFKVVTNDFICNINDPLFWKFCHFWLFRQIVFQR